MPTTFASNWTVLGRLESASSCLTSWPTCLPVPGANPSRRCHIATRPCACMRLRQNSCLGSLAQASIRRILLVLVSSAYREIRGGSQTSGPAVHNLKERCIKVKLVSAWLCSSELRPDEPSTPFHVREQRLSSPLSLYSPSFVIRGRTNSILACISANELHLRAL